MTRKKAASHDIMADLHRMYADYLKSILEEAMGEGDEAIPLDAATMGTISKFLKDNEITCEPADLTDLQDLRDKYTRKSRGVASGIIKDAQDEDYGEHPLQ